jgi:hypothetical protein
MISMVASVLSVDFKISLLMEIGKLKMLLSPFTDPNQILIREVLMKRHPPIKNGGIHSEGAR